MLCSNGHEMTETGRVRSSVKIEEIVYKKERIKHFDREGSEYWAEIEVPDLVEKEVDVDRINYTCHECTENKTVEKRILE